MSESIKATRATVTLGSLTIDGFMLPNGEYRMSQTQASECVGKAGQGISNFLKSKAFNRLLGEAGGTSQKAQQSTESFIVDIGDQGSKGETRIVGLPLVTVFIYWAWESFRGNKQALSLIVALGTETLERRFDTAFGVTRTEDERNNRMIERMAKLESDLAESYDQLNDEANLRQLAERKLEEEGVDMWGLPGDEE